MDSLCITTHHCVVQCINWSAVMLKKTSNNNLIDEKTVQISLIYDVPPVILTQIFTIMKNNHFSLYL